MSRTSGVFRFVGGPFDGEERTIPVDQYGRPPMSLKAPTPIHPNIVYTLMDDRVAPTSATVGYGVYDFQQHLLHYIWKGFQE